MVSIRIADTVEDVGVDFPNKGNLLIRKNVFNSLDGEEAKDQIMEKASLRSATYIHVEGGPKNVPLHGVRPRGSLDLRPVLEKHRGRILLKLISFLPLAADSSFC